MKARIVAIVVGVLALGAVTALAFSVFRSQSVADEDFQAALLGFGGVVEVHNEAPRSVPLVISIRCPLNRSKGGLGFPDRTDVYLVGSSGGTIECGAHIRSNRVWYVTFEGKGDPASLRASIRRRFPGLSTD